MEYLQNDQRTSTTGLTPPYNIYSAPGIINPGASTMLRSAPSASSDPASSPPSPSAAPR